MSNDEKLKEIIAKRYAEIKKENPNEELLDEQSKPDVGTETSDKTISYLPHRIGNKYFLLKVEYFVDMEGGNVAQSDIKILGIVPLAQKIIALQYEQTQAKSLKYYYDSQKNKEINL